MITMGKYYKISCALIVRQEVINQLRKLSMPWLSRMVGGGPHALNFVDVWTWSEKPSTGSLLPLLFEKQYCKLTAYDSIDTAMLDGLTVEVIDHLHSMLE